MALLLICIIVMFFGVYWQKLFLWAIVRRFAFHAVRPVDSLCRWIRSPHLVPSVLLWLVGYKESPLLRS